MSLNVEAYEGPLKRHTNQRETSSGTRFYDNDHFPGRILPFRNGYYKVDEETALEMFDGGYGSYAWYRNELAKLAGFGSIAHAWAMARNTEEGPVPFIEQLYFSDSEGTLGTVACEKLYADYLQYLPSAQALNDDHFLESYKSFMAGFKLAAESGGAVVYS